MTAFDRAFALLKDFYFDRGADEAGLYMPPRVEDGYARLSQRGQKIQNRGYGLNERSAPENKKFRRGSSRIRPTMIPQRVIESDRPHPGHDKGSWLHYPDAPVAPAFIGVNLANKGSDFRGSQIMHRKATEDDMIAELGINLAHEHTHGATWDEIALDEEISDEWNPFANEYAAEHLSRGGHDEDSRVIADFMAERYKPDYNAVEMTPQRFKAEAALRRM